MLRVLGIHIFGLFGSLSFLVEGIAAQQSLLNITEKLLIKLLFRIRPLQSSTVFQEVVRKVFATQLLWVLLGIKYFLLMHRFQIYRTNKIKVSKLNRKKHSVHDSPKAENLNIFMYIPDKELCSARHVKVG